MMLLFIVVFKARGLWGRVFLMEIASFFLEVGSPEILEKSPRSKDENANILFMNGRYRNDDAISDIV